MNISFKRQKKEKSASRYEDGFSFFKWNDILDTIAKENEENVNFFTDKKTEFGKNFTQKNGV